MSETAHPEHNLPSLPLKPPPIKPSPTSPPKGVHRTPSYSLPPEVTTQQKYPPYSQRPSYSYLYFNHEDESRRGSGIVVLKRGQKVREYVSRHRYWLVLIAVMAVGVMTVGVVLVAHTFYAGFGGQGFLKKRQPGCCRD